MAVKTPAEKAELSRKIEELRNREGEIQESLLKTMAKQAVLYENEVKKLTKITTIKELQRKIQKELQERQINTNFLEDNIVKRNQKIIEQTAQINNLRNKITSATNRNVKYSDDELKAMLKFKDIYGKFLLAKKIGGGLTSAEEDIVKKVGILRGKTLAQMLAETGSAAKKTKEMMLQSMVQKTLNEKTFQRKAMLKEQIRLRIEEQKEAKALTSQWLMNLGFVSQYTNLLNQGLIHLKAMGVSTNKLGGLLEEKAVVAGAGLLYIFKQIFGLFLNLDKAAFEARKEVGMMREEHVVLRKQAEDIYKQYAHLGVEAQMVYKTQKAVAMELGSTLSATKEIVEQASLMAAQFGIAEDTSVKMLKTMGQMFNTTAKSQVSMAGFVGELANAAGVPLPQVMDDVAKASETTRTMFARTPLDMIKAAVEARRLGTTLNNMASSSRKILNFTESMEAEMEASVLLGRPINLQLARQLAYSGKIAESNKEILRIAKMTDFEHMDPFQAEAFAKANGKTVEEMRSMIQADREQVEIRKHAEELARAGDNSMLKRIQAHDKLTSVTKKTAEEQGKIYELTVKQQANQDRITSISNAWKKVLADIGMLFLPLIDNALKFAANIIPISTGIIKVISGFNALNKVFVEGAFLASRFFEAIKLSKIANGFLWLGTKIESAFTLVKSGITKIFSPLKTAFSGVMSFFETLAPKLKPVLSAIGKFKFLGTALGSFGKAIPVIGEVIMVLQGVWSAGVRVYNIFKKIFSGDLIGAFKGALVLIPGIIWDVLGKPIFELVGWISGLFSTKTKEWVMSIATGIENLPEKIWKSLVSGFDSAWKWIKNIWGAGSPSKVALSIVEGIASVGSMLFSFITSPFSRAWDFVTGIWNKFGDTMLSFVGGAASTILGAIISPYKMAWDYIKMTAVSVGPMLLNAVSSVSNLMFDNIVGPFKKGWDWISGLFGGGKKNIQPSVEKPVVEAKVSTMAVPVDKPISDKEIKSYKELDKVSVEDQTEDKVKAAMESAQSYADMQSAILEELKGMRQDLISGKIAVNLDGQLVSTTMNRNNNFRGTYGAMQR